MIADFIRKRVTPLDGQRRWWRPEWLLAAASVTLLGLALLAAEGLLRVLAPTYLDERPSVSLDKLHRYSEVYGWELKPGARQREGDGWISVNNKGFRGQDVPWTPSGNQRRVVLLGDSITFGTDVGDGNTFADALSQQPDIEAVNLGVQGYGLGQSLLKLEREGLAYQPQAVVLNVCLANDFADIMLPAFLYDARHPKPFFRLSGGRLVRHDQHLRLSWLQRTGRLLQERSQLYGRVMDSLAREPVPAGPESHWTARRSRALRDERASRALAVALIARMRAVSEAQGAVFLVALHPDKGAFKHGSPWADALLAAPELAGVTMIDMRHEYRAAGLRGRDLMLDGIGHLTPDGHRQAAQVLARSLRRSPAAEARRDAPGPPLS